MKILEFISNQCQVTVYKEDFRFNDEDLYVIVSYHNKTGKVNTRYGNKLQIEGMINCYQNMRPKEFKL